MTDPTVAVCQLAVEDCDVETNLERVRTSTRELPDGVDLAVFPEQTLTGFVPDSRIAEAALSRDGATLEAVTDLAAETDTALVVGFVEDDGEDLYNAAAYVPPDGGTRVYRKRHLWAGERAVLAPGTERVTVDTPAGTAGMLTCYDLNFVDESQALVDEAVELLVVVGAWPAAHSDNWRLLVRSRALDGVRWVVAAGRTGRRDIEDAPTVTYAGRSLVAYPNGSVRAALTRDTGRIVTDLERDTLARARSQVGVFEE